MSTTPDPATALRLGVDLGGTKIELIALDSEGKELRRERVATPQGNYLSTLQSISRLVSNAETALEASGSLGIAIPGSPSPSTGLIRNANSTCLNGQPLQDDLQQLLQRPIHLSNDANCLALSEATDGAGQGAASVFAVILGTGVGAGIVVDGKILNGANGIGGEWGHNPLPWPQPDEYPGEICWCGLNGCNETWLSGPALQRCHTHDYGEALSVQELVIAAENGDVRAQTSLQKYESRLARGLGQVINIVDPEVIVLGGGLSNIRQFYKNIPKLWHQWIFSDVVKTRLLPPEYGDSSGVRGAAWLGTNGHGRKHYQRNTDTSITATDFRS